MEPAELVVGILGLAGLFGASLGAVSGVRAYRSFDTDSRIMDARFAAARLRFEQWRRHARCAGEIRSGHQTGDDRQLAVMVQRVVLVVQSLCGASDADPQAALHLGPPRQTPSPAASTESAGRKLAWVLWGRADRTKQVEDLEMLVQHLHNLLPIDAVPSTRRVPRRRPWRTDRPMVELDLPLFPMGLQRRDASNPPSLVFAPARSTSDA